MNKRLGATAIAACVCGLLFSGAAPARQAVDTITVTGAVLGTTTDGTYVEFFSKGNASSPFKQISLSGGSNFHFSWTGGDGVCKLTPANGGVSCDFTPWGSAPNFWTYTKISGTLPTAVVGTVVYADNSTGTFTAPVTEGPPDIHVYPSMDAVVKGTSIQIKVGSALTPWLPALPPILRFSLSGGSNWHVTAISSTAGGNCSLTADGGGSCAFATPAYGFVLNATFSGSPPTHLSGQIISAHSVTLPWNWDFPCNCTKLSAKLTGFKKAPGDKLVFFLKWQLDCKVGRTNLGSNGCSGSIILDHPTLPHGLQLRRADGKAWHRGKITILCNPKNHKIGVERRCAPTVTGKKELELIGPAAARAQKTVSFHMRLHCGGYRSGGRHRWRGGKLTKVKLTLKFDKHGNLNRKKSHLGKLN